MVEQLGSLELLAPLFSTGSQSEVARLDMEEQEEEADLANAFLLGFMITPVLHLDFRGFFLRAGIREETRMSGLCPSNHNSTLSCLLP